MYDKDLDKSTTGRLKTLPQKIRVYIKGCNNGCISVHVYDKTVGLLSNTAYGCTRNPSASCGGGVTEHHYVQGGNGCYSTT